MNDVLNQDTLSSTIAALLKPSRCDALEQGSTGTYPSSGVQGGAVFRWHPMRSYMHSPSPVLAARVQEVIEWRRQPDR